MKKTKLVRRDITLGDLNTGGFRVSVETSDDFDTDEVESIILNAVSVDAVFGLEAIDIGFAFLEHNCSKFYASYGNGSGENGLLKAMDVALGDAAIFKQVQNAQVIAVLCSIHASTYYEELEVIMDNLTAQNCERAAIVCGAARDAIDSDDIKVVLVMGACE